MTTSTTPISTPNPTSAVNSDNKPKFIEEVSIIIAAQNLTPTMMSQDFLKFSGIIPKEWELAQQPTLNPNLAQLNFTNGVSITAQPRNITVSESLAGKNLEELAIASVVEKYLAKLPYAEYMGLSLSPKLLIPFPDSPESVRQFITGSLLGSGSWKKIGRVPVQAGINLMYLLDRCQLTIGISEARLQQPDQKATTAILFSGNFNYNINPADLKDDKYTQIMNFLSHWQTDLEEFREIVSQKFLDSDSKSSEQSIGETSLFPGQTL